MRPSHSDSKLWMGFNSGCVRTVEPQRPPTGRMLRRFMYHSLFPQPPSCNDEISSVLPLFHLGAGSHPITQLSEHDNCRTIAIIATFCPHTSCFFYYNRTYNCDLHGKANINLHIPEYKSLIFPI